MQPAPSPLLIFTATTACILWAILIIGISAYAVYSLRRILINSLRERGRL